MNKVQKNDFVASLITYKLIQTDSNVIIPIDN